MKTDDMLKLSKGRGTGAEDSALYDEISSDPELMDMYAEMKSRDVFSSLPGYRDGERRGSVKNRAFHMLRNAAAILFIPLLLSVLFYMFSETSGDTGSAGLLSENIDNRGNMIRQYAAHGVKGKVVLGDGSEIWLNSGTYIEYPAVFENGERRIFVSGEAYFKITSDSIHPMIINTPSNVSLKVKGTEFNMKCFPDESFSLVMVDGNLELLNRVSKDHIKVVKDEEVILTSDDRFIKKSINMVKLERAGKWVDNVLVFDDMPMEEVVTMLKRWYGVKVIVRDRSIYNVTFKAVFKEESIIRVLEMLKRSANINYTFNNNTVELFF